MKRFISIVLVLVICLGAFACTKKQEVLTEEEQELSKLEGIEEVANKSGSMWELICRLFPGYIIFKDILGNFTYEKIDTNLKLNTFDWSNLGNAIKGIDVSRYQGKIDWEKVKLDNIKYAFIRAGYRGYEEGVLQQDSTFETNMTGALKNDIAVGVYFVTKALTEEEAIEEAYYLIEMIKPYNVTWPVVIDIEPTSNSEDRTSVLDAAQRTTNVLAFCNAVKEAGYTPMIYAGVGTFMKYLEFERLEDVEKWFAQYFREPFLRYEHGIWQATDQGSVNGIKGNVDIDYAVKDYGRKD